jgi:transcriptional regulator with XRE-family HTH domain
MASRLESSATTDGALPLHERIRAARSSLGMSRTELCERLGVGKAMGARLEAGTVAPSAEIATRLAELLGIEIDPEETNIGSIPALTALDGEGLEALRDDARRAFRYGDEVHSIELPSFTVNGPPDQRPFHEELVGLQESSAPTTPWPVYRKRLSLVAKTASGPTAQSALERPRPRALSWSSNYGPHGWHRYVGRFPPHLVRALLNGLGANADSLVCDPFAGSGTTLVECRLLGIPAVGIEISPLSALIARTKATFPLKPKALLAAADELAQHFDRSDLWAARREVDHEDVVARPGNLVPRFANLERWFTPEALLGVSLTVELAASLRGYARDALLVALSAKMRSIGNVDVDVVRAEYRKQPRQSVDVREILLRQLKKVVASIEATAKTHGELMGPARSISVRRGNALGTALEPGSVTHVITSPPYGVESLSYLRTHLLSFRSLHHFLGQDPYETGTGVIGSEYLDGDADPRGFSRAERSESYRRFFGGLDFDAMSQADRRRATMMMGFFEDMGRLSSTLATWLAPGGSVAFVIGNKKLKDQVIPTAEIVRDLFAEAGLELRGSMSHKLKTNNSNSVVPWQERIISDEFVLLFGKEG